jgi:arylsulfatase A-like enzyme
MTLAPHHNYQTPSTFHKIQYPGANQTDYNDYLNAIRYQDDWMRDLFAEFERRGLMSSTLFVILGDHGESFGEHGERTHLQILYEEALHIPGLLYAPSLWSEGGHVTGLRQEIDVLPTVAEVLGLKLEDGFVPGTSLLKPVPGDRTLYFSATRENTGMALTRGSMKYIYFFRHEPMQVYDLANDPLEQRDLGPTLADAERDRVEQELVDWRQRAVNVFLNKDATAPAKSVQAALH